MAASTVSSSIVSGTAASPQTLIGKQVGKIKEIFDKITVATTSLDDVGDIILLGLIPSNAIITSIIVLNDALDTNGSPTLAHKIGLYYTGLGYDQVSAGYTAGTVISDSCIGSSVTTLRASNTLGVQVRFNNAAISTIGKEAWDLAGLTTEVGGWYALGFKATAVSATAASGTLAVKIQYILPN